MRKKQKIKAYIVYWKDGKRVDTFVIKESRLEARDIANNWKDFDIPAKIKKCEISF